MSDPRQSPRSPTQQFDTIAKLLQRLGYPWIHVADYRDDGISGRFIRKRAGFQQMLLDIRTRTIKVDLIVVDTIERFGRMDELESIERELRNEHGVLIVSADTSFSSPTGEAGRALQFVQNMRATSHGRVLAHNVNRGRADAARRGRWPGGPAPLGLRLKRIVEQLADGREGMYSILVPDPDSDWLIQEMFGLAYQRGWGAVRIAKELNSRPEIVARFGRFDASTIHRMLGNELYVGVLVFGKTATDVVNDRRVIQAQPQDEWIRVEDFCEPLVPRQVFDAVQRQRQLRSEARRRQQEEPGGLIKPLSPGLVLKYSMTGLVRCGECGASMRPNTSGTTSRAGRRYTYYRCPSFLSGRCGNDLSVPEDWLRPAVIAKVRARLFPPPDPDGADASGNGHLPAWLPELVDEVQREWAEVHRDKRDHRPALEKEQHRLKGDIHGWTQSLAKSDLSAAVRTHLEVQVESAQFQLLRIEQELALLAGRAQQLEQLIDAQVVVDSLARLTQVLELANPTAVNAGLSQHIDRIDVYRDRRIIMRTCRLGVFEGIEVILSGTDRAHRDGLDDGNPSTSHIESVKPRRRARLRLDKSSTASPGSTPTARDVTDPDRFAGLEPRWFWEDHLELPAKQCWSALHAEEVHRRRSETGWSLQKLADAFGKSIPTIRRALRIASERIGTS